ncbi:hypothetical protein ACFS7Z_10960 [Pontibacter toksunensis]|uniref:Glycosyltransferase involved in cell wall biosynthesis n=1 Tax=Pontibacter toksunensis TaxID=1332631 RepID=A0ABW6BUZ1_9BACT
MIESYQINQLREAGHEVEIWYLGNLFGVSNNVVLNAPAIQEYLVMVSSFEILKERVNRLEKNSVLFSMLGLLYYYPILYRVIKSREDLIWIGRITKKLPASKTKRQNPLNAMLGSVLFYKLYRPYSNLILYVSQKVIRKYGNIAGIKAYQPDYLMVTNVKQVPPHYPKEKVIVTHADDYNVHLLNRETAVDASLQNAIVFLDQMIYFHPDFRKLGESMTDVDTYYHKLNQALDRLSERYSKPVVIAGHPEAEKQPGYAKRFKGKHFVIGKSVSLVRHAYLVVSHYSTAVNFAAIYNKPLLLLTTNNFETFEKVKRPIQVLSKALNVTVINIDKDDSQTVPLDLNPNYKLYRNNYIKSDDTPEELSYPYAVNYVLSRIESDQVKAK